MKTENGLAGCGKTQVEAFVGALYERPFFLESSKYGRS
jgi:hypothetical protein